MGRELFAAEASLPRNAQHEVLHRTYLELAPPEYEKVAAQVRQRVTVLESQYGGD